MTTKAFGTGLAACLVFALLASSAEAYVLSLPPSLAHELLSESVPTAFEVAPFQTSDYEVEWSGTPLPGASKAWAPGTLQWVRVMEVLVLPRARLRIEIEGIQAGNVSHAGFTQSFAVQDGKGSVEIPVALISGEKNPIELHIRNSQGQERSGELRIKRNPRALAEVYRDPSCSKYQVKAEGKLKDGTWAYVGCRMVSIQGSEHRAASLEMYVFWDGVGQVLQVGGAEAPSSSVSVWPLRLRSKPGFVEIGPQGDAPLKLSYGIPEKFYYGFLGLGLGPYSYYFQDPGQTVSTYVPLITLYSSYFISESMRMVAFDATAFNSKLYTDFGVYLNTEYAKILDRRLTLNVMLGAHVLGFGSHDAFHMLAGAPQGVEVIYTDAFKRGYNLSFGGFVYPEISGKAYDNIWVRWGSPALFVEWNFILWREQIEEDRFYSRSSGLSVGFPIARFF